MGRKFNVSIWVYQYYFNPYPYSSNQNPSPLHQKLSKKHRGPSEVVYEFESSEIPELIKVVKPKDGTEENSD